MKEICSVPAFCLSTPGIHSNTKEGMKQNEDRGAEKSIEHPYSVQKHSDLRGQGRDKRAEVRWR